MSFIREKLKVNSRNVEWSKKIVLISLIILTLSTVYKVVSDRVYKAAYEEELSSLIQTSRASELQNALNSISFSSADRDIHVDGNSLYIKRKDRDERKFIIEDFLYNPTTTTFTIVTTYSDSYNISLMTFRIVPSENKFESYFESVHGGKYEIIYNEDDISAGIDVIFDILDVNEDGKVDVEFYEYMMKEADSNEIYIDLKEFDNLRDDEETY